MFMLYIMCRRFASQVRNSPIVDDVGILVNHMWCRIVSFCVDKIDINVGIITRLYHIQ